jgi:hypothetical protein
MEERRKSVRRRTLKGGRIGFNRASSVACVIRDISPGGAKLSLPSAYRIPSEFVLTFDDGSSARFCLERWQSPTALGVQFL